MSREVSVALLGFSVAVANACGASDADEPLDTAMEGTEGMAEPAPTPVFAPTASTAGAELPAQESFSCPNLRAKLDGEWPRFEGTDMTFRQTLVSSPGEDSFRQLSCGVENSARQPSFTWTAPHDGTFNFSCLVVPVSRWTAIAVLGGDCMGEELSCVMTRTSRFSFDLELTAGQQIAVLFDLDEEFGDADAEFDFAILDTTDFK